MNRDSSYVEEIVNMWKTKESPDFHYYEKFDKEDTTAPFWREDGPFYLAFSHLNISRTLEIACGTGRHSARISDKVEQLYMIDTSIDALEIAKVRFSQSPHVKVILSNDGETIPLEDGSLSAVFSYDAMVHFEATTIAKYLFETARVLTVGGRALFHHSVYDKNPTGNFRDNPGWRNYMSESLFAYFASRAGLKIIQSLKFNERQGISMIDGLTLLEKIH